MTNALKIRIKHHYFVLFVSTAIMIFSFILKVSSDNKIKFPIISNVDFSGFCFFEQVTGVKCPTCGLTKSFISISHLNFKKSIEYNKLGLIIYFIFLFQVPYRAIEIIKYKRSSCTNVHN